MPRGTYRHADGDAEHFQCAPGPGGWRYVGQRAASGTDLTVDSRWRQIRVQVASDDWLIRGGLAGPELLWVRAAATSPDSPTPDDPTEHAAAAAGFLGDSPAFLVAVARSLHIAEGEKADVRLVELTGPALATLTVLYRWELAEITTYETDLAPLRVERYEVADLSTGERKTVHLAGDVVLDAPGIELTELDNPPTDTTPG